MSDLHLVPAERVVHPLTGEAIDLIAAPDEHLGRFLADVREYEQLLRDAKRIVSTEVLRRMDASASWSLATEGYTLKGSSPQPSEAWDELALRSDLWELVDEGVITEAAANAAVETVVTYKVKRAGVSALRKLGGRVAETVNRHCRQEEKPRYISVTPK